MTSGHCRLLQQKDPRKVKLEYGKRLWNSVFDHNPRIARHGETGDFQIYYPRPNGLRPYIAAKSLQKWTWKEYKPPVGEIYLQPDELEWAEQYAPQIVIEPTIKAGASPNKQWHHWQLLVFRLRKMGYNLVQLGPAGTRWVPGVKFVETPTFRKACAVLARSKAAIVQEGGMHHAAAVVGVPAVVIYGGYISPASTGYDLHRNIFIPSGQYPIGCGMRIPCKHCSDAMTKITHEQVIEELTKLLRA